ncbi:hypothetical protein ABPG72_015410 [Tetrahymena utriculariae]
MQNIFENKSTITQSEEHMLSLVGNHIQRKLISENIDNISLDDDSHQILEQMIKDRKLYEEIKDLHKDFLKKQQYLEVQKEKYIKIKSSSQIDYESKQTFYIKFKDTKPFLYMAFILMVIILFIYVLSYF